MDEIMILAELAESEMAEKILSLSPEMFLAFVGATMDEYEDRHEDFDAEAAIAALAVLSHFKRENMKAQED